MGWYKRCIWKWQMNSLCNVAHSGLYAWYEQRSAVYSWRMVEGAWYLFKMWCTVQFNAHSSVQYSGVWWFNAVVEGIPVTRVSDVMVGAVNQKQTPSSLPPHSMFLTEVTSMGCASGGKGRKEAWRDVLYQPLHLWPLFDFITINLSAWNHKWKPKNWSVSR